MAQVTLNLNPFIPPATSVGVYQLDVAPGGPPPGSPVFTGTSGTDGTLTVTGLTDNTGYVAGAQVGSVWRYVDFQTPAAVAATNVADASTTTKGVTKLSVAPVLATNPIAVGDNDPRLTSGSGLGGIIDACNPPAGLGITAAVGDGVANDGAALNSGLAYVKAHGGTLFLDPRKTFLLGSTKLDCSLGTKSYRISGMSQGPGHINEGGPILLWTGGAASGPMIDVKNCAGIEIDHMHLVYDNAAYDGDQINVDGVGGIDATNWHLHHLSFRGKAGTGTHYLSARSNIRVNKAIDGKVSECNFADAINPLRLGDPGGTYVNTFEVDGCQFVDGTNAMILLASADIEAVKISNCAFEAGNNTPAIRGATTAADGGQHLIYSLTVQGCWFGDATTAVTWIQTLHTTAGRPILIQGNYFADNGSTATPILSGDGLWLIQGNAFTGGDVFQFVTGGATATVVILQGNQGIIRKKINNPSTSLTVYENGNVWAYNVSFPQTVDNTAYDRVGSSRFAVGGPAKPAQPDIGSTADGMEDLIVGAFANALVLNPVDKGAVYVGKTPNPSGLRSLMLMAPSAVTTGVGGASIWAGAGPYNVLEVQGGASQAACKLGFNGALPVTKPAVTGSRGGNAALASLLTQLATLGLITDSSTV